MRKFTAEEKWEAARREVAQRRLVYPRLVAGGKMTQAFADRQIAIMDEIVLDYDLEAENERLI